MKLRANTIPRLPPGKYGDGSNLWLTVKATGRRAWSFRFMKAGRARELGLGAWPVVTLAQARARAFDMRQNLALGRQVGASPANTFTSVARDFIARQKPAWRNKKHAAQWESTLAAYAFPVIGHLPVADISTNHVLAILSPIWSVKTETAVRVRGRIEAVLDAARVQGLRPDGTTNPAQWRGHLEHLLPKRSRIKQVRHHRALSFDETRELYRKLVEIPGSASRALRVLILTAARTGEVIGAHWREVDFEAAVWTIPASRMKAGRPHRVPLAPEAMRILHEAPHDGFLFPGKGGKPMSNMCMAMLMRRLGIAATVHGFRSVFRVWAAEAGAPREVAESCLAHVIGSKTEASYLRSDLIDARRALMESWGRALTGD
ncbi:MAG: tyrosine-type recombinase/integrase [Verrucomicrobiales bacterium]|nr:tyrosine-type recombinase/integrase [Verrucomicrobiales bacterium]